MQLAELYKKALNFEFLSVEEGVFLFENAPTADLMNIANELREQQVPHGKVTWIIDLDY
jgi:cyclic dehypoxanthinyl futalosine synthase